METPAQPNHPSGSSVANDVANGVGPTGSPYGGDPRRDDRQWNPPMANEDVAPSTEEKLNDSDVRNASDGEDPGQQ